MPCHIRSTSVSAPRPHPSQTVPQLPAQAVLDLAKPAERKAHDFLLRMSSGPDTSWKLLALCRQESVLLCVVRWVRCKRSPTPFSLVEISLVEQAVYWSDYATAAAARVELLRCTLAAPRAEARHD